MGIQQGSCFYPIENLYYALSVLEDSNPLSFEARLRAFSEFLECFILSDNLVYDQGIDLIDENVSQLIHGYELQNYITIINLSTTSSLEDHFITMFSKLPEDIDMEAFSRSLQLLTDSNQISNDQILEGLLNDTKYYDVNDLTSIYDLLLDAVKTEVLLPHKIEISNFLQIILPGFFPELPEYLTSNEINTWEDFFSLVNQAIHSYSDERIFNMLAFYFQWITETALTASLRDGLIFQPYSLQSELIMSRPLFAPSSKIFLNKLTEEKYRSLIDFNDFIYKENTRVIHLPVLFNYLISKSDSIKDIIDIAIDLREKKEVRNYRRWCRELDYALMEGYQEDARKMISSANDYISKVANITQSPINVQVQISFPPAIIFDASQLQLNRKHHLLFLNKIYYGSHSPLVLRGKIKSIFGIDL